MSGPDYLCLSGSQRLLDDVGPTDPLLVPVGQILVADPGTIVAFDQSPDLPAAEPGSMETSSMRWNVATASLRSVAA